LSFNGKVTSWLEKDDEAIKQRRKENKDTTPQSKRGQEQRYHGKINGKEHVQANESTQEKAHCSQQKSKRKTGEEEQDKPKNRFQRRINRRNERCTRMRCEEKVKTETYDGRLGNDPKKHWMNSSPQPSLMHDGSKSCTIHRSCCNDSILIHHSIA